MDNNDSYFDQLNKEKLRKAAMRNKRRHLEGEKRTPTLIRLKIGDYGKKTYKRKMRLQDALNDKYN